jgi:hypothetical protein
MVSNISMNRKVSTTIIISSVKTLWNSNFQKIGSIDGGAEMMPVKFVMPRGMPIAVVTRIPMSRAPVTFLTSKADVNKIPNILSSTPASCILPRVIKVDSDEVTIPALLRPTEWAKNVI